jgi:hypothetical protein
LVGHSASVAAAAALTLGGRRKRSWKSKVNASEAPAGVPRTPDFDCEKTENF